jgi:hypothetical protein
MDWTLIITLILQLISAIFNIDLSGILGGTPKPTANPNAFIRCADPVWLEAAAVRNNVFTGKIQVACVLETNGSGDIGTLEARLAALNTNSDGSVVYGAVQPVAYGGGLEGQVREVAFNTAKAQIKGRAELVSDGYTELRRSFHSSGRDAQVASQWLREISQEIEVVASLARGKYRVVITTGASVAKPGLVSTSRFLETLRNDLLTRAVNDSPLLVEGLSHSL